MKSTTGLSRRAFLGLGATAAVAAGAGLAGCAPQASSAGAEEGSANASAANKWRYPASSVAAAWC